MMEDCYDMLKFSEGGRWVHLTPAIIIGGKEIESVGFTVNKAGW